MMWFNRLCLLSIIVGLVFAAEYRLPKAQRYTVDLSPQLTVVGSYYPAPAISPNTQLVVLLHMLGRNRGDWNECARFLQKEGYAVISLDLPGHGESTASQNILWYAFSDEDFWQTLGQSERILQDIRQKFGFSAQKTALVGMGYGASLALYLQSKGHSAAAVFIEPIPVVRGIALKDYVPESTKPLYVIVSRDDTTAQYIKERAANCTVDIYQRSLLNPLHWFLGNTIQYEHIVRWLRMHFPSE